jgi:transposase
VITSVVSAEQMIAEYPLLKQEILALRAKIEWLQRRVFGGGKNEKLDVAQLRLHLAELEAACEQAEQPTETITYERAAAPTPPRSLPAENFAHLPVVETVEIVPDAVRRDPDLYERIGEERTFEVDVIEPRLVKREIVRPKYRHRLDRSRPPLLAAAPARVVPGGYASAGLLAWIAISKYVHHLPLFRLEKMSRRWGAQISRRTMCDWMEITSRTLEPLYRHMHRELLGGDYIQADETPVRCNDPDEKRGSTTQGYLWVISRPGGNVLFQWCNSRRHGELDSLLDGFEGILQSDAYGAYPKFARNHTDVNWVACWAHARRYFVEALPYHAKPAQVVLRIIQKLYQWESQWDEVAVGDRRAHLRQEHFTRPLYWLRRIAVGLAAKSLPRSELGKACAYLLENWDGLVAHLKHSVTRLDNNLVENSIRPTAIGKKNWLFIGHPDAGQRSAIIYSLVVSCQRHGKDPMAYLRDVLGRLPSMTNQQDLTPLTPAAWQPSA